MLASEMFGVGWCNTFGIFFNHAAINCFLEDSVGRENEL